MQEVFFVFSFLGWVGGDLAARNSPGAARNFAREARGAQGSRDGAHKSEEQRKEEEEPKGARSKQER